VSDPARVRLTAPAKLNLGLRVVGVRPDGYHEIESLFAPLALADGLDVSLGGPPGIALSVSGAAAAGVPADRSNLAWRAAEAFLREAGLALGVRIALDKSVPSPAGLGGGSSDAGTVLRALDRLAPGRVAPARLRVLALALGADVPFFLNPRPALVEGIGERVLPVLGVPALPVLLALPGEGLATRAVYAAYDAAASLTPPEAPPNLRGLLALREELGAARARWSGDSNAWLRMLIQNDLEPAATRLCPSVAKLREELSKTGARAVGMSGSGPTIYAIFASDEQAATARARFANSGTRAWLTHTQGAEADAIQQG
jgi:4-diphosphocytidyl-2-C-methyl-D-erythritol kinase